MKATSRFLLDTNVLVWLSTDLARIPATALKTLEDSASDLYVSTAAFWELSIKQSLGKIDASIDFNLLLPRYGIQELPLVSPYTRTLRTLPMLHGDPFDRMMIAQAIAESMTVVTADRRFPAYPVKVLSI